MKVGDEVTSNLSLWKGDVGKISGIVDIHNLVHVIFPENDRHYGYQQTFYKENLRIVNKQK